MEFEAVTTNETMRSTTVVRPMCEHRNYQGAESLNMTALCDESIFENRKNF